MNSLWFLDLSSNQITQIDSLRHLNKLNSLYLFHNPILKFNFNIISPKKTQIYISNNNLTLLNESINQFNEIYLVNIDQYQLISFAFNNSFLVNRKLNKKSFRLFRYFKSTHLISLNNLFHVDCFQTIEFMKRKIHFNLFLNEQVEQFFVKCRKLELS